MVKILIIDDDPTIRVLLTRTLQKQGYEVSVAQNGEEGVAKAHKLLPSLIICDWMMPVMDGLEVCRQIKANTELLTTFFILLTSRGALEDRIKGLDTGADDFLSKPIEMNELRARVSAGLRLHQLSQDLQLQKQRLEEELTEAADYVRSLLPPPMTGNITIDSRFIPSKQLGGDSFDYYWLNADELVIYLLDVSGHGVGSALLSVSVLNMLRSQSLNVPFNKPSAVLTALNDTFQMSRHKDLYFTIWYGVYHPSLRQLTYASAGHPPAILKYLNTDNTPQLRQLRTIGPPIGMLTDIKFVDDIYTIEAMSTLYIFSDGVYEICLENNIIWGLKAFIELLRSQQDLERSNLNQILHHIRTIGDKTTFDDDISLLQINFD
ncbi:regulator [Neosynechococcus sphagnicola sy1]|uniref:Regulator n=1 Tax=Neosynechococcus sphagnicola sy1 TaxID=1497020 RepID=A0A098TNM9_9CYAN|nr:SpoIIE family protein phosphatase [Neosynechococcus sphagnicola]KGF73899.1 regulator [Neosynechococcus sphagnicola sy1]